LHLKKIKTTSRFWKLQKIPKPSYSCQSVSEA